MMNEKNEVVEVPVCIEQVVRATRGKARDRNIELLRRMREITDRALEISGLDAEYDSLCRQVTNTFR